MAKDLAPKAQSYENRHFKPWSAERLLEELSKLITKEEAVTERVSDDDEVLTMMVTEKHSQANGLPKGQAQESCRFCNGGRGQYYSGGLAQ